jgi:hypothetical protein
MKKLTLGFEVETSGCVDTSKPFLLLIVYWYLKTFIIMANTELRFLCRTCPSEDFATISAWDGNTIILRIENWEKELYDSPIQTSIVLDKSTAIKFAKTLRTEINTIEDKPF